MIYAGAAKHFERALTLDPTDLDVLRMLPFFSSTSAAWTKLSRWSRPLFAAIR